MTTITLIFSNGTIKIPFNFNADSISDIERNIKQILRILSLHFNRYDLIDSSISNSEIVNDKDMIEVIYKSLIYNM